MRNRVLHLTLNRKSFEIMVTGEKFIEYRKPTTWILSRLSPTKSYDQIKFVNGYGNKRPFFNAKYLGWEVHKDETAIQEFSNGLKVTIETGVVKIFIGEIFEKGNINVK
jgi:hypothetical protein